MIPVLKIPGIKTLPNWVTQIGAWIGAGTAVFVIVAWFTTRASNAELVRLQETKADRVDVEILQDSLDVVLKRYSGDREWRIHVDTELKDIKILNNETNSMIKQMYLGSRYGYNSGTKK